MPSSERKTRIFLDGGDPDETRQIKDVLGFIDGQTTNPSLISKNPEAKERLEAGDTFTRDELLDLYKKIVQKTSELVPEDGSVSIEVYADERTTADEMFEQGREMFSWIENAHIKFPTTDAGLAAAERAVQEGMRVNMTLCFSQAQAAAVYAATRGAENGQVFVSPFIGRLDDRDLDGMSLVEHILRMYREQGDGHVEVLAASLRNIDHLSRTLQLECDILTAPFDILQEWGEGGAEMPDDDYTYPLSEKLDRISFETLDLEQDWREFAIRHPLTDKGQAKFAADWNSLLTD